MNLKNFLWYTGIWTYPPLVALVNLIVQALELSIPVVWQYLIVWGDHFMEKRAKKREKSGIFFFEKTEKNLAI